MTGNNDAGIDDETDNKIFDMVSDEIIPELKSICEKYNKVMPYEIRYIYQVKTNSLDVNYKYEEYFKKIKGYEPGKEAMNWFRELKDK